MLYGATTEVPTLPDRPKSLQLLAALALCQDINRKVHDVIDFPQNWDCLPDKLATQISKLLMHAKRENFFKEAQKKYLGMSQGVQGHYSSVTKGMRKEEVQWNHYHRAVALSVHEHGAGNCGEYVALVVSHLVQAGMDPARIAQVSGELVGQGNNHTCIAINLALDAEPGLESTYGPNCVICDPWIDLVAQAGQYFLITQRLDMMFRPDSFLRMNASRWT